MNNTFSTLKSVQDLNNIEKKGILQQAHNVANTITDSSEVLHASPNISFLPIHSTQHQTHLITRQMAAFEANSEAEIVDPHRMDTSNLLDEKTYLSTSDAIANATANAHYFTATPRTAGSSHPASILIANNFTSQPYAVLQEQQQERKQCPTLSGNIRILADANCLHHSQHGTHELDHPQQILQTEQHILSQSSPNELLSSKQHLNARHTSMLLPLQQAQSTTHYTLQQHYPQQQHTLPQFILPPPPIVSGSSPSNAPKLMPAVNAATDLPSSTEECPIPTTTALCSPVILDRINICIGSRYTDSVPVDISADTLNSVATIPQQPSPIIPAIKYKTIVHSPNKLLNIDTYVRNEANNIDEPDSTTTTTPHTPPMTPDNILPTSVAEISTTITQSPTTTSTTIDNTAAATLVATEPAASMKIQNLEKIQLQLQPQNEKCIEIIREVSATQLQEKEEEQDTTFITPIPPTPSSPQTLASTPLVSTKDEFSIGEDVFIQRNDGRFYLGTIVSIQHNKFLVRFDDRSEMWTNSDEMRKFCGGDATEKRQMCVACKRSESLDIVETCERCGRGYHRSCTNETVTGSGNWICKRCAKPMRMLKTSICFHRTSKICRQLPYDTSSLNWDKKHRVNEEQIYCYCGKTGKFDDNMLQCCRCHNWFHTECTFCVKEKLLLGDFFFVFCCTICNNGEEFLCRLQINWVDLVHLTLYNLSAMKKFKNHKYHHLTKDIWPFVLQQRNKLSLPQTWSKLTDEQIKEKIRQTLNTNPTRFINGREIKKDPLYYALRQNGPPVPKMNVEPNAIMSDVLIMKNLHPKGATENDASYNVRNADLELNHRKTDLKVNDVYEFRIEDEDEKFTSDDEIPIKHIMEKAKKYNTLRTKYNDATTGTVRNISGSHFNGDYHKASAQDESNNNNNTSLQNYVKLVRKAKVDVPAPSSSGNKKSEPKIVTPPKSSRKRKAFTLSKSYKESVSNKKNRISDSSSDENSSSSRGTSLDLIIPPPKNFLGSNNPFRLITPKKSDQIGGGNNKKTVSFARVGKVFRNNSLTTKSLDFSSKLADLKSTGVFSNLCSSDLAKAAGQPRLVRTIKRRLSAKDITIGPNQEVRRRRIRRSSSNVEVISTTPLNAIPNNFIPIHAKDLNSTVSANSKLSDISQKPTLAGNNNNNNNKNNHSNLPSTNSASSFSAESSRSMKITAIAPAPYGRRLRQRPEKFSPNNSRRSSISGASTSSNSSMLSTGLVIASDTSTEIQDLKHSVSKYFGSVNRIESGEVFCIRAKRRLANGQIQYLVEWSGDVTITN